MVKDNKFPTCTKHIDVRYHFVHEVVKDAKVTIQYILTNNNISDMFTKLLVKVKFRLFVKLLGLHAIACKV